MRPRLHHTAPAGWINDPYGLVHRDGLWHLYFQHVPGSATWAPSCHWGHATSPDLLTWTSGDVALAPAELETGCWSGSVVGDLAFYTSVSLPALDDGRVRSVSLGSGERSEVLVSAPPDATHFRDPFVYADGERWRMLLGCATAAEATVWSYTSPDLATWTYDGPLASRSPALDDPWTGQGWECPQLLPFPGADVLVVSVWEPDALHHVAYRVGSGPFRRLTHGPSHYAGSAFTHLDGTHGLVTWLREVHGDGWTGATSLPMTLALAGDRLVARPVPTLAALRVPAPSGVLPLVADLDWAPAPGDSLSSEGFALATSADAVAVTAGEHRFDVPWAGEPLRIVLDGPVLELYGDLGVAAAPVGRTGPAPYTWTGVAPEVHALAV